MNVVTMMLYAVIYIIAIVVSSAIYFRVRPNSAPFSIVRLMFLPVILITELIAGIIFGRDTVTGTLTTIRETFVNPRKSSRQPYPIMEYEIDRRLFVQILLVFVILISIVFVINNAQSVSNWLNYIILSIQSGLTPINPTVTPDSQRDTVNPVESTEIPQTHDSLTLVANNRVWLCVLTAPADAAYVWVDQRDWSTVDGSIGVFENQTILQNVSLDSKRYYIRVGQIQNITLMLDNNTEGSLIGRMNAFHLDISSLGVIIGDESYAVPALCG